MTFNVLLTGVGGEGVLLAATVIARAATIDGHQVGGIQLHGLAQRGGSIPTYVRFGEEVHSPTIPRGEADLIIGLETIEAARECRFADKKRTTFLIDTYTLKPVYARLLGDPYPTVSEVKKMVAPFSKRTIIVGASDITREKLGSAMYGNSFTLGVAISAGALPLKQKSMEAALKATIPRDYAQNVKAFRLGLGYGKTR